MRWDQWVKDHYYSIIKKLQQQVHEKEEHQENEKNLKEQQ
jgi:hypothetical protein